MLSIQERLSILTEPIEGNAWQWACMLRVAIPGQVVSFDADRQTCVVQPLIQEIVLLPPPGGTNSTQNIPTPTTIKPLQDVIPIMMRVPGWSLTFPIVAGTECLLIFADMCVDGWWQSGGVQPQFDRRRHDLSDAFALFGPWSNPKKLANYSTSSVQLRSDDQTVMIELTPSEINITAPALNINTTGTTYINANEQVTVIAGGNLTMEASGDVTITGQKITLTSSDSNTTIDGREFLTHLHSGVQSGGSDTGPVV